MMSVPTVYSNMNAAYMVWYKVMHPEFRGFLESLNLRDAD